MNRLCPEDYQRLARLSSLCMAEDGAFACVRYFHDGEDWRSRVLLIENGRETEVLPEGLRQTGPSFSEGGRRLWFISDGKPFVFDRASRSVREAAGLPEGFEAVEAVPACAGCLAVCRREVRELPPEGCDWEMPLVAEELHYRLDADHGFKKKYVWRLCLLDRTCRILLECGTPIRVPVPLPDGRILFLSESSFCLLPGEGGEPVPLSAPFSPAGFRPVLSLDGRYALAAGHRGGMELRVCRLWLDGEEHPEDQEEDAPAGLSDGLYMDLSPDQRTLIAPGAGADSYLVCAADGHVPGLWRLTVRDHRLRYEQIPVPGPVTEAGGETENGLLLLAGPETCPPEPVLLSGGAFRPLTASHNQWLSDAETAASVLLRAPSLDGRAELSAWLLRPPRPAEKVPLLVWVHGGPSGCWTNGFNLEVQAAVSLGFAVLLPNPRGSTGRGDGYADPAHAFDGGAAQDILMLLDAALRAYPRLDGDRAGVLGGSYGGFMAAFLAGHTARFRAAAVIKGVTNWLFIHFNSSQGGQPILEEYRDFQDFQVDTLRNSPVFSAGQVRIPVLVIHGEKDQQVPVENAHQYYTALKDCHPDLPVKLLLLPDCCHAISRDRLSDYLTAQKETLSWMVRYVRDGEPRKR